MKAVRGKLQKKALRKRGSERRIEDIGKGKRSLAMCVKADKGSCTRHIPNGQ